MSGLVEPTPAQVAYQQGHALFEMGRHQEAVQHLRQAAALEPGYPQPLCLIAASELQLGDAGKALEAADAAVASPARVRVGPPRARAVALTAGT